MPTKKPFSKEELEAIARARKLNHDKVVDKWLEVLELRAAGQTRAQVSEKTGFAQSYITELVREYREEGLVEFARKQYAGNRRNMSTAEEAGFLESYRKDAEQGKIIEVSTIKAAYEEKVGHTIGGNQIYLVLHRHGLRKVMPRSKHPNKASDEVIEASKKLTKPSETRWQIIPPSVCD